MEALILVAENGGPTTLARIGVMRALNRGHVHEFTVSRKSITGGGGSSREINEDSEADRDAMYFAMADEAVLLGPARARDSYLNIERVFKAARFVDRVGLPDCVRHDGHYCHANEAADFSGLGLDRPEIERADMNVFIYTKTSKQVGAREHVKVFATTGGHGNLVRGKRSRRRGF
ncbi:hypothetical protein CQ12_09325 [Bradyrhizobium jicamae]|uniref:Biotin carboxylase-like N-terminal domain-containing protein n=1 Tax=Bradyrhizobium jicamae TaxID=280332 RepID=A0A0R3LZ65_9BRAD|nr:hypothetical protein CQ12_09325 [Bradyrhizobium jicamae]